MPRQCYASSLKAQKKISFKQLQIILFQEAHSIGENTLLSPTTIQQQAVARVEDYRLKGLTLKITRRRVCMPITGRFLLATLTFFRLSIFFRLLNYFLLNLFKFFLSESVLAERNETEQYHKCRKETEDDTHTNN